MKRRETQRKDEAPARTTFSTDEARVTLGELSLRAGYGGERIILTRRGKPVAAIVGLRDLAKLEGAAA